MSAVVHEVTRCTLCLQVTLMKYLYKAMENLGDTSGNVVLGWHEKVRCMFHSSVQPIRALRVGAMSAGSRGCSVAGLQENALDADAALCARS